MDVNSPFPMLAAYNAWANRRLYDAAAALPDADYRADRGAFFKSVHGTLNQQCAIRRRRCLWVPGSRFARPGMTAEKPHALTLPHARRL